MPTKTSAPATYYTEVPKDNHGRPRVYIEEEFPIQEVSIECRRERGAVSAFPAVNYLHVWWARRPLTVSRAAILGSMVPAGKATKDFLAMLGIPRNVNPVQKRRELMEAKAGLRKDPGANPYGYKRAFTVNLPVAEQNLLQKLLLDTWGTSTPRVLDCFSGGGSIPFEAYRLGMEPILNELNPVAVVIERATVEFPAKFGVSLAQDIEKHGKRILASIQKQMQAFVHHKQGEEFCNTIWLRTVHCENCNLEVPLTPNWWLNKPTKVGYRLKIPDKGAKVAIEVRTMSDASDQSGTIKGGSAECPRCKVVIDGDRIKSEAQQGRLGHQMAAIQYKLAGKGDKGFRSVLPEDESAFLAACDYLEKRREAWDRLELIPNETRYIGPADRSANYGVTRMVDLFNPRQLLCHMLTLEAIRAIDLEMNDDPARRRALKTYLAFAMDKGLDYNSILCRLHSTRGVLVNTFDEHDFAFVWSYCEMDGRGGPFEFGLGQQIKAYKELVDLLQFHGKAPTFNHGSAAQIPSLKDGSVDCVVIDPPYSDNVMYAECADFFYVWQKRSLGSEYPELFSSNLTDKDAEAVANAARFKESKGKASALAETDYNAKMQAAFQECYRVLRTDGVMTVMFTHKKLEAWDALSLALLEAGFEITATWPVHTESEHSTHQADKNSASSTILLVCRKRTTTEEAWWDDIKGDLDAVVKSRAAEFTKQGIPNQDIYIMCFGPALQVISEKWPVKKMDGTIIRPEEALQRAREVLKEHRFSSIAQGAARGLDAATQFYILAWDTFRAREFPYDEARRLALAAGINEKQLLATGLVVKKGSNVQLASPEDRAKAGKIKASAKTYDLAIDYVHAAILAYASGKSSELKLFHERTKALANESYRKCLQVLSEPGVMPMSKDVPEYETLMELLAANPDIGVRIQQVTTEKGAKQQQKGIDAY